MPSINDQSKTCFVFSDGEGGFVVKMCQPNGKPLDHALDLHRAVHLNKQLTDAIAQMVKPPPETPPEKWYQR